MKISLNWIKDYVSVGISVNSLVHKLTMAGLEVEKVSMVNKDTILELEITPNRADCLNMVGVSREVAAILNKTCDIPKSKALKFPSQKCEIKNESKKGCGRYIGTVVENVNIGESPQWIQKRLGSLEMQPINNVVDITNFCLLEFGQPLHAFDYDKIIGGQVIVRYAREGEKIITLDGVERKLDPSILVIADIKRPIAIAGIMGGKDTEVTNQTKNILLESAYFDPILIRRAARKLKLSSDSSYRFERGVSFEMVEKGANRALSLILQSAKGTITRRTDNCTIRPKDKTVVEIKIDQINHCLGSSVSLRECRSILKRLDFETAVYKKNVLKIHPPLFRSDIKEGVDIIEEVARIIGYDNLPLSLPRIQATNISTTPKRNVRTKILGSFCGQGFSEVITYSMINQGMLDKTRQENLIGIKIKNPLTQDQEIMRPGLLPSLLTVVHSNLNRGQQDIKIFEIGKSYSLKGEKDVLGLMLTGRMRQDWRVENKATCDIYDMKGTLEKCFEQLQLKNICFEAKRLNFFEEGQSAIILKGNKKIGVIGKVKEQVLEGWDIKLKDVFFAEIDLEVIYAESCNPKKYAPVTDFPMVTRDVSLAVKENVRFQQIKDIALQFGGKKLVSIKFVEQYLGDKIPKGYRGVIFSLKYGSAERTLREDEVAMVQEKIEKELISQLEAIRR